jgi:hypothetical protein
MKRNNSTALKLVLGKCLHSALQRQPETQRVLGGGHHLLHGMVISHPTPRIFGIG